MKNQLVRIIISKKKSNHGNGHHGGSWKIAYADFMTAMMALFLVMWLINAATPQELKGVAEYFKAPIFASSNGGNNISDSDSPIPGGGNDFTQKQGEVEKKANLAPKQIENAKFIEAVRKINDTFEIDPRLKKLEPNLIVELTEIGLRIQILASDDQPMFGVGSAEVQSDMQDILYALAPIINSLPNKITLSGHTDERQYASGDRGYSNWELSADRANSSRRELIAGGLDSKKIIRIIALADTVGLNNPKYSEDANRRISILILNKAAEQYIEEENKLTGIDFLKQTQQIEQEQTKQE
ncbi:flagellar motor protein MotB [uncultured Gilliamella sp.]|uniref:flagellar motor protein MotB n=1 Tax=uncultured Gilliamella sp. TaxID=1193505 RepID=UPI0025EF661F|nr:flagellar motor protein MotB [uncultured Gilliamella sp.]